MNVSTTQHTLLSSVPLEMNEIRSFFCNYFTPKQVDNTTRTQGVIKCERGYEVFSEKKWGKGQEQNLKRQKVTIDVAFKTLKIAGGNEIRNLNGFPNARNFHRRGILLVTSLKAALRADFKLVANNFYVCWFLKTAHIVSICCYFWKRHSSDIY